MKTCVILIADIVVRLCAYFVDYAFVIVVIKESYLLLYYYYYYYYYWGNIQLRHHTCM